MSGVLGLVLAAAGTIWRKISGPPRSGLPWYKSVAQAASAIFRLQIAEGDLDSVMGSLLLERQEGDSLRLQLRAERTENQRLRDEIARQPPSPTTASSDVSSDGSTRKRGTRPRRRRIT
jgi:hypothetical protein